MIKKFATLAALVGFGSGKTEMITRKELEGLQIVRGFLEGSNLLGKISTKDLTMDCANNIDKVYEEADLAFKLIEANELSDELYGVTILGKMIKHISNSQDKCGDVNIDW